MLALATTMVVLGAADLRPEAWVVVSQRSSVAKGTALEVARQLQTAFAEAGVPSPAAPEDLSANCSGKVPCLATLARKKGVSVLVTLEIGSAFDELLLRVAAISVEEDGRVVERADIEGNAKAIAVPVREKVRSFFAPAVRKLLALPDPNAKPAPPPPAPEPPARVAEPTPAPVEPEPAPAPAPEPAPAAAVTVTEQGGGWSTGRWVGVGAVGVGAVMVVSGIVAGAVAQGSLSQRNALCPQAMQCNDPVAYQHDASFRGAQTASGALIGVGLAAAAAGAVLFVLGGSSSSNAPGGEGAEPPPSDASSDESDRMGLAPVIAPGYGGLALSGTF